MVAKRTKYSRRSVTICREGWYYLFVLSFIAGGAILRQVNPLFGLSAVMVAPMIFNWRIAMASLRQLQVKRRIPTRITAGDLLTVDIEVANHRQRLDTYTLYIRDRIALVEPNMRDYKARAECTIARIPTDSTAQASYRCHLNRRGRYRFGPLRFSTRFPAGLIQAARRYRSPDEIIVAPRIGKLTPAWTNLVFREQAGTQQTVSRRGAQEGNYYAMRQWRSGDTKRWIHWRTSARLGQLMVKQYEQQSERDLTLVFDAWQPEKPTEVHLDHIEMAASVVATAFVTSTQQGAGQLSVGIAAKESVFSSSLSSSSYLNEVLAHLAIAQAVPDARLDDTILEAVSQTPAHARIVLVTTRSLDLDGLLAGRLDEIGTNMSELMDRLIIVDVTNPASLKELFSLT